MCYLKEDNSTVNNYDIASTLNKFSVSHQQDMCLSQLLCSPATTNGPIITENTGLQKEGKELSEPMIVHCLDMRTLSSCDKANKSFDIIAKNEGSANCLVYWFTLDYGWDVSISNYQRYGDLPSATCTNLNKQAMITFNPPISTVEGQCLKFVFLYCDGLIDFVHLSQTN